MTENKNDTAKKMTITATARKNSAFNIQSYKYTSVNIQGFSDLYALVNSSLCVAIWITFLMQPKTSTPYKMG